MAKLRTAVVGVGATGTVLAAALLRRDPDTVLVVPRREPREALLRGGVRVRGALAFQAPVSRVVPRIADLAAFTPDVVFLCTKTCSLEQVLEELSGVFRQGMKIVSAQNGLGPEDVIAERFGSDSALRLSLNYGAAVTAPGEAEVAFFNPPNPLGAMAEVSRVVGSRIASQLTDGGLKTAFVDDIKLQVWRKMVIKCTMASICAVADLTIREALDYPPTREIADACFQEALAVARAAGYDLGEGYLEQALGYLAKVGAHKDSMCQDLAAGRPTEIDFLGARVVDYGREHGVHTPYFATMTNLVRAAERPR